MSQALKSKNEDESGSGEWRLESNKQSSKEAREERERERVDEE